MEDLRKSLVAQGHEDVFFNVILDKASENDLWTITSLCDYPVFVSETKTSGWDDQGGSDLNERSVSWVYNGDGTLSDPDDLNPWKKGIGVPINMGEFSADVNKALTKALEVQAAFKAQ